MVQSPKYTLGETVNDYLIRKFNQRRKYYANYFKIAQDIYKDTYRNLMPTIISKYVEVIDDGDIYPYVLVPDNMFRFYSISVTNKNKELLEVFYNNKLNIYTKPAVTKNCGCTSTDLCDCIDNLQVVITPKVIDDVTYYIKEWVVCCPDGTVKQYAEVPVANYSEEEIGPYSFLDYSNDYQVTQQGGLNITYLQFYKNLGKLDTKDCGCPVETDSNKDLVFTKCGCFLGLKPDCCKVWYEKTRVRCTGEMKFSECGTKIYLKDVKDDAGFVVISFQTDPVMCGEEIMVDDFARRVIWFGMEYESIVFYPKSNAGEKKEAERRYSKAQNELWSILNPVNSDRFFNIPSADIRL